MFQNKSQPLVSVVIPTYKRSDMLDRTINSVLRQTYGSIEIVVVDDNGVQTENQRKTESRLSKYILEKKITYIAHERNKNGAAARNTGFSYCHGKYVNFIDDDDIMLPKKIETQVSVLEKSNDNVGAVYCNSEIWTKSKFFKRKKFFRTKNGLEGRFCKEYLLGQCMFNTSSILFKSKTIKELNGFDESFVRHQDYELMVRFFRKFDILPSGIEPLVVYDASNERMNIPNSEKDFEIKKKFISTFSDDFENLGIKSAVCHEFWMRCAIDSLKNRNARVAKSAVEKVYENKRLALKDFCRLVKAFILGIF